MLRIIRHFFVTLGVIFFILIIAGISFIVIDPWHIRPLLWPKTTTVTPTSTGTTPTSSTAPAAINFLNESQRAALQKFGIDPASLPTTITASQEACFVGVLGQARVDEIKAGAVPSALEFLRASACL